MILILCVKPKKSNCNVPTYIIIYYTNSASLKEYIYNNNNKQQI